MLPTRPEVEGATLGSQAQGRNHMAGNIVHFEINAKDASRAKRFYSSLFGWKYKHSEIPGMDYYLIDGASPRDTINTNTEQPGPVVYFDTHRINATTHKVRDLGTNSHH